MKLPKTIANLIEVFEKLPGIGPRTAARLAYFLVNSPDSLAKQLAKAAFELKAGTKLCSVCKNIGQTNPCEICQDNTRNHAQICVVEEPQDLAAVENSQAFKGVYHVLHGRIAPLAGLGPDDIYLRQLVTRVKLGKFLEVIVATNADTEGETTAMYIARLLKETSVKITRLAQGIPTGGDVEYADEKTLKRAFEGRTTYY